MSQSALFDTKELQLPGVLLITPKMFPDSRGYSVVTYTADEFAKLGITEPFVQDYASFSKKDVIRGLHYQRSPYAQDKLVRCATGRILDVVVDHDRASETFGSHVRVELDAAKGEMLYVPGRYAHGFCVLSREGALVEYKIRGEYHPESAGGIRFNDPTFNIEWPVTEPILSEQDRSWTPLSK